MGKWDQKKKKIEIIKKERIEMQKQLEKIRKKFEECELLEHSTFDGKERLTFTFDHIDCFIDFKIKHNKEDIIHVSGNILFGAFRNGRIFKNKPQDIIEREQEVFVAFDFESEGRIKGQAGIDEEWFFDCEKMDTTKDKTEEGIKEVVICALDFMLTDVSNWVNKGAYLSSR